MYLLPDDSILHPKPGSIHYTDSYSTAILSTHPVTIEQTGSAFLSSAPRWVEQMLLFRDNLVRLFGLKVSQPASREQMQIAPGEKAGPFIILDKNKKELILGQDDKHLNFWVSLYLQSSENTPQLLLCTTLVHYNNIWGRLYFFFVKPFHRLIVPSLIKNVVHQLNTNVR